MKQCDKSLPLFLLNLINTKSLLYIHFSQLIHHIILNISANQSLYQDDSFSCWKLWRRPLCGAGETTPHGNPVTWWLTFFDVVVLMRAVPGWRSRWMLQLFINDEDRWTVTHSAAMVTYRWALGRNIVMKIGLIP